MSLRFTKRALLYSSSTSRRFVLETDVGPTRNRSNGVRWKSIERFESAERKPLLAPRPSARVKVRRRNDTASRAGSDVQLRRRSRLFAVRAFRVRTHANTGPDLRIGRPIWHDRRKPLRPASRETAART